jgi:hypothetical protein
MVQKEWLRKILSCPLKGCGALIQLEQSFATTSSWLQRPQIPDDRAIIVIFPEKQRYIPIQVSGEATKSPGD